MSTMREDANLIISKTIKAVFPEEAVMSALANRSFGENIYLAAIGKAAYAMAETAHKALGERIKAGVVVTKYGHARGSLDRIQIVEAGHPIPDENTLKGAQMILDMTAGLKEDDQVIFLVSGGGSALFEKPAEGISLADIEEVTKSLLACGADIVEINTVRKRLSAVKGGRFALHVNPARIFSIVLSDVIGDRLDSIASGPAYPDSSTTEDALSVVEKYRLSFRNHIMNKLRTETPKSLQNVETVVTGSVSVLCQEAAKAARLLGYEPHILSSTLACEAKEGGRFLAAIAREIHQSANFKRPCAIIVGGETVVTLKGTGKGGRNQEFALAAADSIGDCPNTVIFSLGSDGTDGPTDAAGGMVDEFTGQTLLDQGIKISEVLENNDAYHALKQSNGLIMTGPTGTNVNDVAVLLCR